VNDNYPTLVVVTQLERPVLELPGIELVLEADYLTAERWSSAPRARVFNLCRDYRYQSGGYYVSLLAAARRHRPFPDVETLLDMGSRRTLQAADEGLEELVQKSLSGLRSEHFTLSIYFGRNLAQRHEKLASRLFGMFPAPLLRAEFRKRGERWKLRSLRHIALRDVPADHYGFLMEVAEAYFARPRFGRRKTKNPRYHLAILHDPDEELRPSEPRSLKYFEAACSRVGIGTERILAADIGRLLEFDALFIRETTRVHHHTFRFAQMAAREGLVVIDDPISILRCTNKVFQVEALASRKIPAPKTLITSSADPAEAAEKVGFPCVLKVPDGSFSVGVSRVETPEEYHKQARAILAKSDLLLVQEFLPTEFDWRIGVLDGEAFYACKYLMARGHWQIALHRAGQAVRYGAVEPVALEDVPPKVLKCAVRAAGAMGDGLYGVDLKQLDARVVVVEVNDNPNLDHGCEDALLGDALWDRLAGSFLRRLEAR
jgi:glutathione synthase/RimK-type ligase-like ATP-grasp enzyme